MKHNGCFLERLHTICVSSRLLAAARLVLPHKKKKTNEANIHRKSFEYVRSCLSINGWQARSPCLNIPSPTFDLSASAFPSFRPALRLVKGSPSFQGRVT